MIPNRPTTLLFAASLSSIGMLAWGGAMVIGFFAEGQNLLLLPLLALFLLLPAAFIFGEYKGVVRRSEIAAGIVSKVSLLIASVLLLSLLVVPRYSAGKRWSSDDLIVPVAVVYLANGWTHHRWRRRLGKADSAFSCLSCGYDLRATPERCPECGRDVGTGM